jgi:carbamoyltransferase
MASLVLGISAFYHDSAAAIVRDGEIIAAAQEERFSRKKHDSRFPKAAIDYCLGEAFADPKDLSAIVFYDHPLLTLDRVLRSLASVAPRGKDLWMANAQDLLSNKLHVAENLRRALGIEKEPLFVEHHASHAASAFYPSPFADAAIITVDGVGEWATTTIGHGRDTHIEILRQIDYPHSLGLLYSAFTSFCGFKVNSGEYKLMGLAPYGTPRFAKTIREKLIDLKPDGSFRLDTSYFGYLDSNRMTNQKFEQLFEGPPRKMESRITRREMDLAASIQVVLEDALLAIARHAHSVTGSTSCVLAGGVALNAVANGRLKRERVFRDIWIQPAAGDAGGALGAALLVAHTKFDAPRHQTTSAPDSQKGSLLGPAFSSDEVRAFLDRNKFPYKRVRPDERALAVAMALADGKIVGFAVGRMEYGPRALGARSILGDPRQPDMQARMNLKIKFRESFRPFAPAVLQEMSPDYFDLDGASPYMLLVAPVRANRRVAATSAKSPNDDMLEIVRQKRSDIPAVTHVDYSARIQTVGPEASSAFRDVIREFHRLTGCPVVVNTSFNVRGEPIVCTPADSYRCFQRTEIDMLVLEDCILQKQDQPQATEGREWMQEYELD